MKKYPTLFRYILLVVLAIPGQWVSGQIRTEITSRTDTFSILGTCSDNKVKFYNLPENSVVSVSGGRAIAQGNGEYILCRFNPYKNTKAYMDSAELTATKGGKVVYSRKFGLIVSKPSGSKYNPILHATIGGTMSCAQPDLVKMEITVSQLASIIAKNSEIKIEGDSQYVVSSGLFSMLPKGRDLIGPYAFSTSKWTTPYISNALKLARPGDRLFLEDLVVKHGLGGTLYTRSMIITVSE